MAKPADPNFTEGKKAIDAKDWARAIPLFQQVVAKDDKNADAFNWLGYALRNQGDYPQSFAAYEKALTVDPRHRGAHEYIGEAYLKVNNLQKAEEHLKPARQPLHLRLRGIHRTEDQDRRLQGCQTELNRAVPAGSPSPVGGPAAVGWRILAGVHGVFSKESRHG